MNVKVKSITEVQAKDEKGAIRTQPDSEHADKRVPIVERVEVELVDADGKHVALLQLGAHEEHGLEVGAEYDSVLGHVYEHAAA